MNLLFVCSMGMDRSPEAVNIALHLGLERKIPVNADYMGIDREMTEYKRSVLERLHTYDKIFVMDEDMGKKLVEEYKVSEDRIICLYIDEDYDKGDPILKSLIRLKLENFIK